MTAAGIFLGLAAVSLVVAFSSCVVDLAGINDLPGRIVAFLLAGAAELVVLAQLLSFVHAFSVAGMLVGMAAAAAAAVFEARRRGVFGASTGLRLRERLDGWDAPNVVSLVRGNRAVTAGVAILSLIFAVEIVLAIAVAPNTFDSLTYHLTRAAYWIQNHSIAPFDNATARQASFPVNAEVFQAWVMMFTQGDRLVQLVQFAAQIGALASVFGIARLLGHDRSTSFFAVLVAAAFPVMIAQATNTQTDLVVAFFTVASVLFTLRAVRSGSTGDVCFAAAAFGLGIGTKFNAIALVPIVGLILGVHYRAEWYEYRRWAAAFFAALLALGVFSYAQNISRGAPLMGSVEQEHLRVQSPGELPENAIRITWASIFDMPHLAIDRLDRMVRNIGHTVFGFAETENAPKFRKFIARFNHEAFEDYVGFGPLALLVLIPALLIALRRHHELDALLVAVSSVMLFVIVTLTLRYNIWILRFLLPAALLAAPLVAALAVRGDVRVALLLVVATTAAPMLLYNGNKLLLQDGNRPGLLSQPREHQMSVAVPQYAAVLKAVDAAVPDDARLGYVGTEDTWEYPYFGPHLERHLVRLAGSDVAPGVFERFDLDAIVVAGAAIPMPDLPGVQVLDNEHLLIARQGDDTTQPAQVPPPAGSTPPPQPN